MKYSSRDIFSLACNYCEQHSREYILEHAEKKHLTCSRFIEKELEEAGTYPDIIYDITKKVLQIYYLN